MEITCDDLCSMADSFILLLAVGTAGTCALSNRMASYAAVSYYRHDSGWII